MFPFDPMMFAQLAQGITANPMAFADVMAGTGLMPPPVDPGMFGANMNPVMPGAPPVLPGQTPAGPAGPAIGATPSPIVGPDPFGGAPSLGVSMAGPGFGMGNPSPMGGVPQPGNDPMAMLRAAGRGQPTTSSDTKPIMSGGISGAGRAPDANMKRGASGEMQLLMQLLQGGATPPAGLGQLLAAGIR
jgi:hypothetical protein